VYVCGLGEWNGRAAGVAEAAGAYVVCKIDATEVARTPLAVKQAKWELLWI
jgi:hypothetical protein